MGLPWSAPGGTTYRKLAEITQPGPSETLTFVDERIDTVNDGSFSEQKNFDPNNPGAWVLRDKPTALHERGGNFAYADGHAAWHPWRDTRTLTAPRNDAAVPGNVDVLWLQQHSTWHGN